MTGYRFYVDGKDVTDQVEFDGGTFKMTGTFTASTTWDASMTYSEAVEGESPVAYWRLGNSTRDIIDRFAKDLAERFPADG